MNEDFTGHFDVVGSFLRPECLKRARKDHHAGRINDEELKAVEDECIGDLIDREKRSGLRFITDGEFRRAYWHLDFMWGFDGIEAIELDHGYLFHDEETTKGSICLTGALSGENHPFIEHFRFVHRFEDAHTAAKQTVPAPAQLLAELFRGDNGRNTIAVYPDEEQLLQDIAAAYLSFIDELYAAGCRNLQFDDCTWGMLVDERYWKNRMKEMPSLEQSAERYLRLNNLVLEHKPHDMVINTHVCRGNYHSSWASAGAYDPVARFLFARERADGFYLEFDDERSGGFEPLAYVPDRKQVVLGLITTKRPLLEDKAATIARLHEAAKHHPLERLSLSPQCGFASCEIGNKLTEAQQWAKVALVKEIAQEVWG